MPYASTWACSPPAARRDTSSTTCSLGVYPELVRERDRWSKRIGGWPAGVVATLRVLRADRHPLQAPNSRARSSRCGSCSPETARTTGWARCLPAVTTSRTAAWTYGWCTAAGSPPYASSPRPSPDRSTRSPAHAAVRVGALRVEGAEPGTLLAYDGEVTTVDGEVTLRKLPEALTVYRPLQQRR